MVAKEVSVIQSFRISTTDEQFYDDVFFELLLWTLERMMCSDLNTYSHPG